MGQRAASGSADHYRALPTVTLHMATVDQSREDLPHTGVPCPRIFKRAWLDRAVSLPSERATHRTLLLDEAADRLQWAAGNRALLHQTLDEMIVALRDVRRLATADEWADWKAVCRSHPVTSLVHEDPFTRRAFEKPRGHAGDAELLDYIYGREEVWPAPPASPLGLQIFDYTTRSPAPEGVRARRAFVARMIDDVADERRFPDVLSIAAGHLREVLLSAAVKRRRVGRLVAMDADPLSMELVAREYGRFGVETEVASIRKLLTNQLDLGSFDLVYSTGLFDYLSMASSRRLVTIMFGMLKPSGCLVVANFLPGVRDVGYMEIFMDWNLIFRTRYEMVEMTMEIPQEAIRGIRLFAEENQNIIFLEVVKK